MWSVKRTTQDIRLLILSSRRSYITYKGIIWPGLGVPLFYEQIEAWQYGPVVPEVYYEYVAYGALNLQSEGTPRDCEPNWRYTDKDFVDSVLKKKLPFSASSLVGSTHREMPWLEHKQEVELGGHPTISTTSMKRYFSGVGE